MYTSHDVRRLYQQRNELFTEYQALAYLRNRTTDPREFEQLRQQGNALSRRIGAMTKQLNRTMDHADLSPERD